METILKITITLALIGLNAFFVAAEFCAVGARRSLVEENAHKSFLGKLALRIKNKLDLYLSTCQFGITVASLGLGFVAEQMLVDLLEPIVTYTGFFANTHVIAVSLALIICTALHVSVGEVAPKNAAIYFADRMLPILSAPLIVFTYIFYPIIWFLNECGNLVLRTFGVKVSAESHHEPVHTISEIKNIIQNSVDSDALSNQNTDMLTSIFSFREQTARHIMTPRVEVDYLLVSDSTDVVLEKIVNSSYTRFPLCEKQVDNVIGLVHVKDVMNIIINNYKSSAPVPHQNIAIDLKALRRDINIVPWSMQLDSLLQKFQSTQIHMAAVFNEHGTLTGIVTLEDVIEEVVGEIDDEFDQSTRPLIKEEADDHYIVLSRVTIKQLVELLELPELEDSSNIITLHGYLFRKLDRLPEVGDQMTVGGYRFKVITIESRRCAEVEIKKI